MIGLAAAFGAVLGKATAITGPPMAVPFGYSFQVDEWKLDCRGYSSSIHHCSARRRWRSLEIKLSSGQSNIEVEVSGGCRGGRPPVRREHEWERGAVLRIIEIETTIPAMLAGAIADGLQACRRTLMPNTLKADLHGMTVLLSELTTGD